MFYFSPLNCIHSEGIDLRVEKAIFFTCEFIQFLEFTVCIPHLKYFYIFGNSLTWDAVSSECREHSVYLVWSLNTMLDLRCHTSDGY